MKRFLNVVLVVALSILLSVTAFASDGGEVPSTEDAKQQNSSYFDKEEPEESAPEKEPEETVPEKEPEKEEKGLIDISLLKESVQTDLYKYSSQTKTLEIVKDGAILTGENANLSLKFKKDILHVTFRDLIVAQTEKELISYNNGQALWIKLEGENMLWAEEKFVDGIGVMFHGQGEVGIYGEKKAFKDKEFEFAAQDAKVTIAVPVNFKKIFTSGNANVTVADGSKFKQENEEVVFAPVDTLVKPFPFNFDESEEAVNVSEFVNCDSDMEDSNGRWYYNAQDKRLVIYKTGVCLTGENKSLSIEPTKGASTINIKDLTIDSTGATCACGKSCAICNGKSYPVFQMINVVGKNSITVAEGAVLYWVSDSLELNGNGKVTFIGNNFAFSDPALTVYVSGANVTFTGNTDFKEILVTGGAITLPKGNEEANVINRSADGKLYFSHLGLKTEADFPCVGLSHQGAVLQGGSAATPGENWNISTDIGNKTVSIGLIWVILVPTVSVITITGLVIALIRKNKKA